MRITEVIERTKQQIDAIARQYKEITGEKLMSGNRIIPEEYSDDKKISLLIKDHKRLANKLSFIEEMLSLYEDSEVEVLYVTKPDNPNAEQIENYPAWVDQQWERVIIYIKRRNQGEFFLE